MLITLYETKGPYSYEGLSDALFSELNELGEACRQEFEIMELWRYGNVSVCHENLEPQFNLPGKCCIDTKSLIMHDGY